MYTADDLSFHIGLLILELHIPAAQSLKAKRSVVKRFKDRVQNRFSCSIAEVGHLDKWQRAALAAAVVGNSAAELEKVLQSIELFAQSFPEMVLVGTEKQVSAW